MIPLATKLFGSQLCAGRQARPEPYGARYVAVRLERSLGLPWQLKFFSCRHGCSRLPVPASYARLFLDLLALDLCARSTFSSSFSFPYPPACPPGRLSSTSRGARRDPRWQLKVPARPGRLHDP